jgi:hypothetical protein
MIFSFAAAALVCVSQPVESSSFKINQMFKTEGIFRQLSMEQAVLRIHDILVWIRISLWVLNNESRFGSSYFR